MIPNQLPWKNITVKDFKRAVDALAREYDRNGNHGQTPLVLEAKETVNNLPDGKPLRYRVSLLSFICELQESHSLPETESRMAIDPDSIDTSLMVRDEPASLRRFEDDKMNDERKRG